MRQWVPGETVTVHIRGVAGRHKAAIRAGLRQAARVQRRLAYVYGRVLADLAGVRLATGWPP